MKFKTLSEAIYATFFFALALCLAQPLNAQGGSIQPQQEANSEGLQVVDFNFEYFPQDYSLVSRKFALDSATSKVGWREDTSSIKVFARVKKEGNLLTVSNLQNITVPIYSSEVSFVGLGDDNYSSLVYRSLSKEGETIVLNPAGNWLILVFRKNCGTLGRKEEECDSSFHYFGSVPESVKQRR